MNGILIIDKPAGITSHDVVARCRKILKTKRIGHTGTLDPFATGVIVILVGKATRLAQFLDKDAKEYEAIVRFGFETDTGDRTGELRITNYELRNVSIDELENVLADFRGEIEQTPPMFSAKKVAGKKLYELARKGIEIERKSQKVTIYELETIKLARRKDTEKDKLRKEENLASKDQNLKTEDLQADDFGPWTLDFGLRILCSAGTYIRTLAEDIGKKLGVGAHLAELRRTRAGNFDLSKAVTLEELETIAVAEKLDEVLISMNEAVSHLPQIVLSETEIKKTQNGIKLKFENREIEDNQTIRMIDEKENLVAVGFYDKQEKSVQPRVVLV
ncbi:MAG: tRNA pseudouridine(55) synthase TruB [Acidobacteria bacterium]|nr:tRNA pseudouridine(55) synthase TruB [Acidobacteriota bacterium]MCA1639576.1 tRNA pseudouridine(55) synthase TruB [Acidobacteriota bacterium]